jgi:hypothetical protein
MLRDSLMASDISVFGACCRTFQRNIGTSLPKGLSDLNGLI